MTKRKLEQKIKKDIGLSNRQARQAVAIFAASGLMVQPRKGIFGFLKHRSLSGKDRAIC